MNNTLKFCIVFLALLLPFSLLTKISYFSDALEINNQATVISSRCCLYSSPDFSSDKITIIEDDQEKIIYLTHNQSVKILTIVDDFAFVSYQNVNGYIYKYYLTQNSPMMIYPVFNASVREDSTIYDIEKEPTINTALKGSRVFIYSGFDSNEELTAIQIVLADGSLYNGYIKTEDLKPDGISGLLIAGITIIIAGVTIILSLLFIRKKKKK